MDTVDILPQYSTVLVRPMDPPSEAARSLILVTPESTPVAHWGEVMAVGPDVIDLKRGDIVVYPLANGQTLIGGLRLVREESILARIETDN